MPLYKTCSAQDSDSDLDSECQVLRLGGTDGLGQLGIRLRLKLGPGGIDYNTGTYSTTLYLSHHQHCALWNHNKFLYFWYLLPLVIFVAAPKTTRAALGAVEPLGRHQYLKHELHAIGPSIKLSKYSALTR